MAVIEVTGFGGLNTKIKPLRLPAQYQQEIKNMIPMPGGQGLKPIWGYTRALAGSSTDFSSAPVGCFRLKKQDGSTEKLWVAAQELWRQDAESLTRLSDGTGRFHLSHLANFVPFKHKAIILQDGVLPQLYDPDTLTVSDLGGWSASFGYPTVGYEYRSRVWLTGSETVSPNRIWVSNLNDETSWRNSGTAASDSDAFFIDVPFNPKSLSGSFDFMQVRGKGIAKRLIGEYPYTTGGGQDYFRFINAEYVRGTTSHRSVINIGNDQIYLSGQSIVSMQSVQEQAGFAFQDLSEAIEENLKDMSDEDKQDLAFALTDQDNGYIFLWYAVGGISIPTKVIILDYQTHGWGLADITAVCGLVDKKTIYFAGTDGNIYKMNEEYKTFNGSAIEYYAKTAWHNFTAPNNPKTASVNKKFKEIIVDWETENSSNSLTVDVLVDNKPAKTYTLATNVRAGSLWGSAVWGQDEWSVTVQSSNTILINDVGKRICLKFRSSNTGEIINILSYSVDADILPK